MTQKQHEGLSPQGSNGHLEYAFDLARKQPGGEAVVALACAIASGHIRVANDFEMEGGWKVSAHSKDIYSVEGAGFEYGVRGAKGWQAFAVFAGSPVNSTAMSNSAELSPLDSPLAGAILSSVRPGKVRVDAEVDPKQYEGRVGGNSQDL